MTPAEIQSGIAEGRRLQRAGQLNEAEALYRRILGEGERDDMLEALAQVMFQKGDAEGATEILHRSVQLKPDNYEHLANLGMVLATRRQFGQAIEYLRRAIALRPNSPELLNNLGAALKEIEKLDEAVGAFDRAIALKPGYAEAHYNRGVALQQQLKWEPAKEAFERAISLRQNYLPALINLGAVLLKLNQSQAGKTAYRQALEINADHADAWYGLGAALQQMGRNDEAIDHYHRALALRPDFADAAYNLGKAAADSGRSDEAIAFFQKARELRPDFTEASNSLALALKDKERWDEALQVLGEALRLKPDDPSLHINLGTVLLDLDRFDEALAAHCKALEIEPNNALAMWNKAMVLLATGKLKEGFEAYEARLRVKDLIPDPDYGKPKWDGSDLNGRTIFLHAEQGFGDTIQFARYIPMLHASDCRVIVQCPRPLHSLLEGQLPIEQLLGGGDPLPEFDVHCSLPSLPYRFGTTLDTIPADVPYLRADPRRVDEFAERIRRGDKETGRQGAQTQVVSPSPLKVGLAWAGNPLHRQDKHRSIPFNVLSPLFDLPDIRFFSLQKGPAAEALPSEISNLTDWTADLNNFGDTAALIANLDLVIAVDTVVVHVAGAMRKPAWVLLAVPTDWRWMLDRPDTPWYPSLRLFRQPRRHDWTSIINKVVEELRRLVSANQPK